MIKDIIVRRRPSSDMLSEDSQDSDHEDPTDVAEIAPTPISDPDTASEDVARQRFQDSDLARAVQARSFVPKHAIEPCRNQPEWHKNAADQMPKEVPEPKAERVKSAPKIWDVKPEAELPPPTAVAPSNETQARAVPSPEGRTAEPAKPLARPQRRVSSERVKTRLLGFHADEGSTDLFASAPVKADSKEPCFPIGWLVVVDGPGRGASFTLTAGLSTIGRDMNQTVVLDFGDTSISRERHASVAYDEEENCAYVGHGGKSNIVRHNGKPLLTTEELAHGDTIKIGKTQLKFVAFCTPEFSWNAVDASEGEGGQNG